MLKRFEHPVVEGGFLHPAAFPLDDKNLVFLRILEEQILKMPLRLIRNAAYHREVFFLKAVSLLNKP